MGGAVKSIGKAFSKAVEAIVDAVVDVWKKILVPALESMFAVFGIEDETVVTVEKVSVPVLADGSVSYRKSQLNKTILQSLKNGDGFYRNYVKNMHQNKGQISSFYSYAKNAYVYGLPNMLVSGNNIDFFEITEAINTDLSGDYVVITADATFPLPEVWIPNALQSSHNYIPYLGTLTHIDADDVSYDDWQIDAITYNTTDLDFDVAVSRDSGAVEDIIKVPNYERKRYLVTTYHEASAPESEWYYWLYDIESEEYPNIDPSINIVSNLEMLPVAILRKNKQFINEDMNEAEDLFEDFGKSTEVYRTTKVLMRRLGLDLDDVIESIGDNPDIDFIDDAYVNFAINPIDNNKTLSKILWMQFYEIIVTQQVDSNVKKYTATFSEQDINNGTAWTSHRYFADKPFAEREELVDVKVGEYLHEVRNSVLYIWYRKSEDLYDEIYIVNLSGMSAVEYDGYHNIAFTALGDDSFTIPVSWYILKQLTGPEIVDVFADIFRIDVTSIQITHLEWYQTGAFKVFFQVVMVVVTIITAGASATIVAILQQLLVIYAIGILVTLVIDLTGNKTLAAAVAIFAAVALGGVTGGGFDLSTINGLTNTVTTFASALSATGSAEANYLKGELDDLVDMYNEQQEYQEANSVYSSQVNGVDFINMLSPESQLYFGLGIQYDFDLTYSTKIDDFFDNQLITGPL